MNGKIIYYTLDPSLDEPACTTGDGRILISPVLVPEEYRGLMALHEHIEWYNVIRNNPPVLYRNSKGDIITNDVLFPLVAGRAHQEACVEELEVAQQKGIKKDYSEWRVKILIDGMKNVEEKGILNSELHDRFLYDLVLFISASKN